MALIIIQTVTKVKSGSGVVVVSGVKTPHRVLSTLWTDKDYKSWTYSDKYNSQNHSIDFTVE